MQLKELKQELSALRVAKVTGGAPNKLSKMYVSSTKIEMRGHVRPICGICVMFDGMVGIVKWCVSRKESCSSLDWGTQYVLCT